MSLPLQGITVLEFCQYLAGPYAGLRLADLGATVIKVERPGTGDACRQLATKNLYADGDSLVFHTINRNKSSYAANLKDPDDLAKVKALIASADVMTHNFRPGIMEKMGLDYDSVRHLNPGIVYGEVTGYGKTGPWCKKPGQDLLIQAVSGLGWLTGTADDPPTPFGLAVADMICGNHLAQGLLAALVRRKRTGAGAHIEVSLLESLLDLQFEVLTTYFNDGEQLPQRAGHHPAHAYLGAPYGLFETSDGHIAIAMGSLSELGRLVELSALASLGGDTAARYARRDDIHALLNTQLKSQPTDHWLRVLEQADYWCSPVFNYAEMTAHPAYQALGMEQEVERPNGTRLRTLRCPIQLDGERLYDKTAAPALGNINGELEPGVGFAHGTATGSRSYVAAASSRSTLKTPARGSPGRSDERPLEGMVVVDFSQFLSGPSASLQLADLGARVIKVERPGIGDICRRHYVSAAVMNGESSLFHAINRNKESFCADLKSEADIETVRRLIATADVVMHNFRPGVMERLGLGYEEVCKLNAEVVYAEVSGYGSEGPWDHKPGQDLLAQSVSGLTWLSGNAGDGPVPMGLAIADLFAGAQLAQGILAKLAAGEGGRVQVSLFESILDVQFEPLTLYFQDGREEPVRLESHTAHAYVAAPYGFYQTADGYLALAMGSIPRIGELIGCEALTAYVEPATWFSQREEIKQILAIHLLTDTTDAWLARLEPADIWCARVHDWESLRGEQAYRELQMEQDVEQSDGYRYRTTRCPIRVDGQRLFSAIGSPALGEHTRRILDELNPGKETG